MKYRLASGLALTLALVLAASQEFASAQGSPPIGFTDMPWVTIGTTQPSGIASGDFNHDGYDDLVVSNADRTLTLLLSNHDVTFTASTFGTGFGDVHVADVNGDGNLDVVSLGGPNFDRSAQILYGDGIGHFSAP